MSADLARLNRELVEHRKNVGAGAALVAYSLALFAFGLAAAGVYSLGLVLVALAGACFVFGAGAVVLHAAHAAYCARRIRAIMQLPTARLVAERAT